MTPQPNPFGEQNIKDWMNEAESMYNQAKKDGNLDFLKEYDTSLLSMGWLKNGFVLTFFFLMYYEVYILKKENEREDPDYFTHVFKKVISVGGDTDTNACVVCAVIGAVVGFKKLPINMVGQVLSFDCTKDVIRRDKFLSVKLKAVPLI